jgi:hypothetical protein
MIKIESLEENPDLEALLEPKKRIFDLVTVVNGSMLNFHKTVKDSKELEQLANNYFAMKENIKAIRNKSISVDMDNLTRKISNIKSMKSVEIDFI